MLAAITLTLALTLKGEGLSVRQTYSANLRDWTLGPVDISGYSYKSGNQNPLGSTYEARTEFPPSRE